MRLTPAALIVLSLAANAAEGEKTLTLPRSLHRGEIAVIEVRVGTIARGQEIHLATSSGRELGVISPFGVKSGHTAGTYPVPVPRDAVVGRDLTVHVTITGNGALPRAPTPQEVLSVEVLIGDPSRTQGEKQ